MKIGDINKQSARHMFDEHGQEITYIGVSLAEIKTPAIIENTFDLLEQPVSNSAAQYAISLLVEDVGVPNRGDTVIENDGTRWVLAEELPQSDQWVTEWAARRRFSKRFPADVDL